MLKGNYFNSVVLSFLAVLGINKNSSSVFYSLISYLPNLLKFIKIAQILVVQRLVLAIEDGKVEHPLDMLDVSLAPLYTKYTINTVLT
jgi:hypothetical protein